MLTNTKVTIWNRYFDKRQRTDIYQRNTINKVHFEESEASNIVKSGLNDVNKVVAFIPFNYSSKAKYVSPKEFEELENKEGFFTLNKGDYIAKGDIEVNQTKIDQVAYKVTTVDTQDYGSKRMRHWEVGAK